jgi:hypothetical protein
MKYSKAKFISSGHKTAHISDYSNNRPYEGGISSAPFSYSTADLQCLLLSLADTPQTINKNAPCHMLKLNHYTKSHECNYRGFVRVIAVLFSTLKNKHISISYFF